MKFYTFLEFPDTGNLISFNMEKIVISLDQNLRLTVNMLSAQEKLEFYKEIKMYLFSKNKRKNITFSAD